MSNETCKACGARTFVLPSGNYWCGGCHRVKRPLKRMTREEAIGKLKECSENSDIEKAHSDADNVLCWLLQSLGYEDVVAAWIEVDKWYA